MHSDRLFVRPPILRHRPIARIAKLNCVLAIDLIPSKGNLAIVTITDIVIVSAIMVVAVVVISGTIVVVPHSPVLFVESKNVMT